MAEPGGDTEEEELEEDDLGLRRFGEQKKKKIEMRCETTQKTLKELWWWKMKGFLEKF